MGNELYSAGHADGRVADTSAADGGLPPAYPTGGYDEFVTRRVEVPKQEHAKNLRSALHITGANYGHIVAYSRSLFFREDKTPRTDLTLEASISRLSDHLVARLWDSLSVIQDALGAGNHLRPMPNERWLTSDLPQVEFRSPGATHGLSLSQMLHRGTTVSHLLGRCWYQIAKELQSPLFRQAMPWFPRTPIELLVGVEAEFRGSSTGPKYNRAAWRGEGQTLSFGERPEWHLPELEALGSASSERSRLEALIAAAVAARRFDPTPPFQELLNKGRYISPSGRHLATMRQLCDAIRSYSNDSPEVRSTLASKGVLLRRSERTILEHHAVEQIFISRAPVVQPAKQAVEPRGATHSQLLAHFFPHYANWEATRGSKPSLDLPLSRRIRFPTKIDINQLERGARATGHRARGSPRLDRRAAIELHNSLVARVFEELELLVVAIDKVIPHGAPILTNTRGYVPSGPSRSLPVWGVLASGVRVLHQIGEIWNQYWKPGRLFDDSPQEEHSTVQLLHRPRTIQELLAAAISKTLGADSERHWRWRPSPGSQIPPDVLHYPELDTLKRAASVDEQLDLLCLLAAACPYYGVDQAPLVSLDGTIVTTKSALSGAATALVRDFPVLFGRLNEFPQVAAHTKAPTDASVAAGRKLLAMLPPVAPPNGDLVQAAHLARVGGALAVEEPTSLDADTEIRSAVLSAPLPLPPSAPSTLPDLSKPLPREADIERAQQIREQFPRTTQALSLPTAYEPTVVTIPELDDLPPETQPASPTEVPVLDLSTLDRLIAQYATYYNTWIRPYREALRAVVSFVERNTEGLLLTCSGYHFRYRGTASSSPSFALWELLQRATDAEVAARPFCRSVIYHLRKHAAANKEGPHRNALCGSPITLLHDLAQTINPAKAPARSTARLHLPSLVGDVRLDRIGVTNEIALDTALASYIECSAIYGAATAARNPSIVAPTARNGWDVNHLQWLIGHFGKDSSLRDLLPTETDFSKNREIADHLVRELRTILEHTGTSPALATPVLPPPPRERDSRSQWRSSALTEELAQAPGLLMYALDCFGFRDELRALTALRRKSGYGLRGTSERSEQSGHALPPEARPSALELYTGTLADALQRNNRVDLSEAGLEAHRSLLKAICFHHFDRNVDAIISMLTGPLPEFPPHIRPDTIEAVAQHMRRLVPPIVQLLEQVRTYQRPPGLQRASFPHQEIALSEIQLGKRLLGLGPGLGKTQVACEEFARLRARQEAPLRRMLFVSDAANRVSAHAEIAAILDIDPQRIALIPGDIAGGAPEELSALLQRSEVVVVASGTLRTLQARAPERYEAIAQYCATDGLLAVDEAHRMDHLSRVHFAVRGLKAKERLFLTGTLMQSHHRNLGNLLHLIYAELYPNAAAAVAICENPRTVQALLAQHAVIMFVDDVAKPFDPFADRSAKEQLADGVPRIPRLTQRAVPVLMPKELSAAYIEILTNFSGWCARQPHQASAAHKRWRQVHTLKRAIYQPERLGLGSAEYLLEAARTISNAAAQRGEQVLSVWTNTTLIEAQCQDPSLSQRGLGRLDGTIPADERHATIRRYQAGELQQIVGQFGAMSTGLNLQGASQILIGQYPILPLDILQTIARARRIVTDPRLAREELTVTYLVPTLHPDAVAAIPDDTTREKVLRLGTIAQVDYEHAMHELQRFEYLARKRGGSRTDSKLHLKRYLDTFAEVHQNATDQLARRGETIDAAIAALPPASRLDYGNPKKESWGRREVDFVATAFEHPAVSERRLVLLSGPNDHQIRRFERRGFSRAHIHAVEGGSAKERDQFEVTMSTLNVPHTVGRLEECVHTLPGPFHHASLDWDGYLQPQDVATVMHLPLTPQATLTLNVMCGRERDAAKALLDSSGVVGSRMLQRKALAQMLIELAATGGDHRETRSGQEIIREHARTRRLAAVFAETKGRTLGIGAHSLGRFLHAAYLGSRTVELVDQFVYRSLTSGQRFLTTFVALRAWDKALQTHPATLWARAIMHDLVAFSGTPRAVPRIDAASLQDAITRAGPKQPPES